MKALEFELGFVEPHPLNPLICIAIIGVPLFSIAYVRSGKEWGMETTVLGIAFTLSFVEVKDEGVEVSGRGEESDSEDSHDD